MTKPFPVIWVVTFFLFLAIFSFILFINSFKNNQNILNQKCINLWFNQYIYNSNTKESYCQSINNSGAIINEQKVSF